MPEIIETRLIKCGDDFITLEDCIQCEFHDEHQVLKEATEAIPAYEVIYCLKPRMREISKIKKAHLFKPIVRCAQIPNIPYIDVMDCKKCVIFKGLVRKTENGNISDFVLCGLKVRKNISFHIGGNLACLQ